MVLISKYEKANSPYALRGTSLWTQFFNQNGNSSGFSNASWLEDAQNACLSLRFRHLGNFSSFLKVGSQAFLPNSPLVSTVCCKLWASRPFNSGHPCGMMCSECVHLTDQWWAEAGATSIRSTSSLSAFKPPIALQFHMDLQWSFKTKSIRRPKFQILWWILVLWECQRVFLVSLASRA